MAGERRRREPGTHVSPPTPRSARSCPAPLAERACGFGHSELKDERKHDAQQEKPVDAIPDGFSSYEEAAESWDAHDTADSPEAFRTVEAETEAELRERHCEVEVDEGVIELLRRQARKRGVSVRRFASDMLRRQLVPTPSPSRREACSSRRHALAGTAAFRFPGVVLRMLGADATARGRQGNLLVWPPVSQQAAKCRVFPPSCRLAASQPGSHEGAGPSPAGRRARVAPPCRCGGPRAALRPGLGRRPVPPG